MMKLIRSVYAPKHRRLATRRAVSVLSAASLLAALLPLTAALTAGQLARNVKPASAVVTNDDNVGLVTRIAGGGTATPTNGMSATNANFYEDNMAIGQMTTDNKGDVFYDDWGNEVYEITPSGTLYIVAGNGTSGQTGDGGLATSAEIPTDARLAVDGAGDLFIGSTNLVRKVSAATGIITTIAGTGVNGYTGDGGPALSAEVGVYQMVSDPAGNLYVGDGGNIRRIDATTGIISNFAGNGTRSLPTGADVASGDGGPATSAAIGDVKALYMDRSGNLYLDAFGGPEIREVSPTTHVINTFATQYLNPNDDDASFFAGSTFAVDNAGNVFYDWGEAIWGISATTGKSYELSYGLPSDGGDSFRIFNGYFHEPSQLRFLTPDDSQLIVNDTFNSKLRSVFDIQDVLRSRDSGNSSGTGGSEMYGGSNPSEGCGCAEKQATRFPVNTSGGNFWHTFNDVSIPGRGGGLSFSRTYNSQSGYNYVDSPLGYGWSFTYGMSLNIGSDYVLVNQENGSQVSFSQSGSTYTPAHSSIRASLSLSGSVYTFKRDSGETFTFDTSGRLTSEKDLNGYVTSVTYPDSSHIVVTDTSGRTLTFTLTGSLITGVTDPAGRTESFSYDSRDNLTDVIDVAGGHWQFTYDSTHDMLTMRSPRYYGDTTTSPTPVVTNVYDIGGRVTSQKDQLGRTTTFDYTSIPYGTKVTDPSGNVEVDYYEGGLLVGKTLGYGTSAAATTQYQYTSGNQLAMEIDPDGNITSYRYDTNGNQVATVDALDHEETATYDSLNDRTSLTDANGVTTTATFDSAGNLLTKTQPYVSGGTTENETTTYSYGDSGHPGDVTSISDALGHATTFTYDSYGDIASDIDPDGNKTTYTYNGSTSIGWVASETAPKGNVPGGTPSQYTTTYTRNNYGQVLTAKDPLWSAANPNAHIATNVYDADGNLTSSTDGLGNTTSYTYDAAEELTKTTNPDATTQQTTYNDDGSIHTQKDGNSHTTTYAYDARADLTSVTDPLGRTTNYVYDPAGNVVKKADPSGSCSGTPSGCTTYSYSADNRLTNTSYSDGTTPSVSVVYDVNGRETSMTDGTGTSSYSYDTLGRLTSQTDGGGNTVSYGYSRASQLTSITYPGSHTVSRAYDPSGNLVSVQDWLGNLNRFTYDPDGDQTSTLSANGVSDAGTFDQADELTNLFVAKGTAATLTYSRNGGGLLSSTTSTGVSPSLESFGYDVDNRLNSYNGSSLTYDNAGNLTKGTDGATISYDNADEVSSKGSTSYGYNTRGDRTSAGSASYSYDQADRLKGLTSGSTTASYAYDGNGQRTSKTVGSATSHFVYDNAESPSEILSDGTNGYVYGPSGKAVEQINGTTVTYLHQDQQGSTRVLTDASKNVVGNYSYDPYGTVANHTGAATTPLEYDGQYLDSESGLYWLRARYYDPATAAFMTVDPLASTTGQPYSYAGDSPTNASDPSGLCWSIGCDLGQTSIGQDIVNVASGFVDTVTFGYTASWTASEGAQKCSLGYLGGSVATLAIPGGGEEDALNASRSIIGVSDDATAGAFRGLNDYGGGFSPSQNAAGGTVWTSSGSISQNDFLSIVNSGLLKDGQVNILSGVHGTPEGNALVDQSLYNDDVRKFGDIPGVNVYNLPSMTPSEIRSVLDGPGTTIGGFCDSAACLARE